MKKIFGMLIILVLIYLGMQLCFRFFGNGHEYQYQITTNNVNFNVEEKFVNNTKGELNSYYFEISNNGNTFFYQTLSDFGKKDHIIKNIYSFVNDEYNCILPVFEGNKIITDIMCIKDKIVYFYHDIEKGNDLKSFAKSLGDYGYKEDDWSDKSSARNYKDIVIYPENIEKSYTVGLSNYKGVYLINPFVGNQVENINLFGSDIYKRPLSTFIKNYYVTANYNEKYRFTKFSVVDLTNGKTKEINCETEISFDSYIQGTNDDSIYIYDRSSKKQYEINLKTSKVLEVGNEKSGIVIYNNGKKERINPTKITADNLIFNSETNNKLDNKGYDKIDFVGGEETGYYYLYKKEDNKYKVYRSNIQNTEQLTYVFSTTDMDRVVYKNDFVYFLDNNILKYYNDITGVKSIVKNSELQFNNSLIFGVYEK